MNKACITSKSKLIGLSTLFILLSLKSLTKAFKAFILLSKTLLLFILGILIVPRKLILMSFIKPFKVNGHLCFRFNGNVYFISCYIFLNEIIKEEYTKWKKQN